MKSRNFLRYAILVLGFVLPCAVSFGQETYNVPDGRKDGGEFSGQGTMTWPDGTKYVGEWKDGKRNGQGTWTSPDGQKYVGEWKDHKFNGQGTWICSNGTKYVGEFQDGTPTSQCVVTLSEAARREKEDLLAQAKSFRIWTNTQGQQITARHLGSEDEFVILEQEDSKTITVRKSLLSTQDQDFVRKIEKLPELEPVWNEDLPDLDKIHFVRQDAKITDENGTVYTVLTQRVTAYARKGTLYAVWYWRSKSVPSRKGLVHSSDFISQPQYVATVKAIQAEKERLAEAKKQAELARGDEEYHQLERDIANRKRDIANRKRDIANRRSGWSGVTVTRRQWEPGEYEDFMRNTRGGTRVWTSEDDRQSQLIGTGR